MSTYMRSLTHAEQLVGAVGLNIEYPYDDLVFIENNPFLLRFDAENSMVLHLHFNHDCEIAARQKLSLAMAKKAQELGIKLNQNCDYTFKQRANTELIDVIFENPL